MKKYKDETGNEYGRLTVLRKAKKPRSTGAQRGAWWLCFCECGNYATVHGKHLRDGATKSCGCLREEDIGRFIAMNTKEAGLAARHAYYASYRAGARGRGLSFNLSEDEFGHITSLKCHYCGRAPFREVNPGGKYNGGYIANGIDRTNSLIGYRAGNIVPCCQYCNFAKGTMEYEVFRKLVKDIYQNWAHI